MPIYAYRATGDGCNRCQTGFDHLQKLAAPDLTHCPHCGAPIQRQLAAPALAMGKAHLMREKTIGEKGFTQYKKIGKGVYEKTAGKGPAIIKGD